MSKTTSNKLLSYAIATDNHELAALVIIAGALEVLTPPAPAARTEPAARRLRRLANVIGQPVPIPVRAGV